MSYVVQDGPAPHGSQIVIRSRSASRVRPPSRPGGLGPPPPGSAGLGPPPGSGGFAPLGTPGGAPFKRLIIAADGTWQNSDNGLLNGEIAVPSNVTRITRAIKDVSREGIPQVIYYKFGIGSRGGTVERVVQGAFGEGLEENVRESYSFLCNNYTPGDEIFLFGFSRGAFTVRTIAGLIDQIGLLTKKGLSHLVDIHTDVKHRRDPNYVSKNPHTPFPDKPSAADPAYAHELQRRGLTTLGVKIKVVGVWDTVGSLGIPRIGFLNKLGLQSATSRETTFYDTKLSDSIENAFQALALDEKRTSFAPAIWEKPPGNTTVLRQVWFPGEHSNIGGGNDDQELANITLAWMIAQVQPFLDMRPAYVLEQSDENELYYETRNKPIRHWSCGNIPNYNKGIFALGGGNNRTPGGYHAVNPGTGNPTPHLLRDTHEYIHSSVRTRLHLRGPGVGDRGLWHAPALSDNAWRLDITYNTSPASDRNGTLDAPIVVWKLPKSQAERGQHRVLPEAPLFEIERELCRRDPEAWGYVVRPPPSQNARARNKERKEMRARERESGRLDDAGVGVGVGGAAAYTGTGRHDASRPRDRDRDRKRNASRRRASRSPLPTSSSPLPLREREVVERFHHRRGASGVLPPRSPAVPGAFPDDVRRGGGQRRAKSVDLRDARDARASFEAPLPPSRRDERRRERDREVRGSEVRGSRVSRKSGGPPSVDSWELEDEDDSAYVTNSPPPPRKGGGRRRRDSRVEGRRSSSYIP